MLSAITVNGKNALLNLSSGWGDRHHVRIIGSTFPILPPGTAVASLSIHVPEGLHALAFSCKVDEPRRMGSGKTAYLDQNPLFSSCLMLCWKDGDKLIIKDNISLSGSELAMFNPFLRSDTEIIVPAADNKTVYVSSLPQKCDQVWTYKVVSVDAILDYITKKLDLEGLDNRATSEQRARDELQELRGQNRVLRDSVDDLTAKVRRLETKSKAHEAIADNLVKVEWLYKLIQHLPPHMRPKCLIGFFNAVSDVKTVRAASA